MRSSTTENYLEFIVHTNLCALSLEILVYITSLALSTQSRYRRAIPIELKSPGRDAFISCRSVSSLLLVSRTAPWFLEFEPTSS